MNLSVRKHGLPVGSDVIPQSGAQHIRWHRRLERAFADEEDDGMENCRIEIQVIRKAFRVTVILPERVLERILPAMEALSPLGLAFRSEDRPLDVLRLDHE